MSTVLLVSVLRRLTQCELALQRAKAESGKLEGENIALQQVLWLCGTCRQTTVEHTLYILTPLYEEHTCSVACRHWRSCVTALAPGILQQLLRCMVLHKEHLYLVRHTFVFFTVCSN